MKFVKRISLFFIYPLTMFAIGFGSNMAIMEYFYPGSDQYKSSQVQRKEKISQEENSRTDAALRTPLPVSAGQQSVITANTLYVVRKYDSITGKTREEQGPAPDMYIGFSREKLAEEILLYNENPSLTDQQQGFIYMELISFSADRVVVRKSYDSFSGEGAAKEAAETPKEIEAAKQPQLKQEETGGFFLLNEDHYVVVYDHSLENVYMNTDISVDDLPYELQDEILHMKYIEDERELYDFLESYSS